MSALVVSAFAWFSEAFALLCFGSFVGRAIFRALASWRHSIAWQRERDARHEMQRDAASDLAETLWLLSVTKNGRRRAQLEAQREARTRRLLRAFEIGDES